MLHVIFSLTKISAELYGPLNSRFQSPADGHGGGGGGVGEGAAGHRVAVIQFSLQRHCIICTCDLA